LARRLLFICPIYFIFRELGNEWEGTRLEALRWISVLLERHRTEVIFFLEHQMASKGIYFAVFPDGVHKLEPNVSSIDILYIKNLLGSRIEND